MKTALEIIPVLCLVFPVICDLLSLIRGNIKVNDGESNAVVMYAISCLIGIFIAGITCIPIIELIGSTSMIL